jgi:hypothetical protein
MTNENKNQNKEWEVGNTVTVKYNIARERERSKEAKT